MTIDLHGHGDPLAVSGDRARGRRRSVTSGTTEKGRLALSESVTIRNIEAVREELLAMMQRQPAVEVDCAALAQGDLSLIQLLLSARKSAGNSGGAIVLAQPAAGILRDLLTRAGLLAAAGGPPREEDAFWLQGARAT
jgi:anti-anti-sigma regulatory factor